MPVFKMERSYESARVIKTDDLLTAVKHTCNYEGDLYVDGSLVMSCLGLPRSDNTRRLLKRGITSYVNQKSQCWNYRYTDPAKNGGNIFGSAYHHLWDGKPKIDFMFKEYRESAEDREFTSLSAVMAYVREEVAGAGHPFDLDEDIHVRLFGAEGLIYFASGDWQREDEPEMFTLEKEGHKTEYGPAHYMLKRYMQLSQRYEGYELKPAATEKPEGFQLGEVVTLTLPVDGVDDDDLFLIDGVESVEGETIYTIRDLDEYKKTEKVVSSLIAYPEGAKAHA
jgi:hypothetical protein